MLQLFKSIPLLFISKIINSISLLFILTIIKTKLSRTQLAAVDIFEGQGRTDIAHVLLCDVCDKTRFVLEVLALLTMLTLVNVMFLLRLPTSLIWLALLRILQTLLFPIRASFPEWMWRAMPTLLPARYTPSLTLLSRKVY
jgi:hypothetical protein